MAINSSYHTIIVESFYPADTSGRHGPVHIRPAPNQPFSQSLFVECSIDLADTDVYPVGTRFRIKVKLTDRKGGTPFLYSYYHWPFEVVSKKGIKRRVVKTIK